MDEPEYLTVRQVAQHHGVTQAAVYRAIARGRLTCEVLYAKYLVPRQAALAWEPVKGRGRRTDRKEK